MLSTHFRKNHFCKPQSFARNLGQCLSVLSSMSVGFVRLSPVIGVSDHCLSHDSLAVIQMDAIKNERHHTNACSIQLTRNKWACEVTQADNIKSGEFLNMVSHTCEDPALKAYFSFITY